MSRKFLLTSASVLALAGPAGPALAATGVPAYAGPAYAGPAQAGPAQTGPAYAGPAQTGPAGPAVAAGLPPPPPLPPPSWTGFYLGGQIGYVWGDNIGTVVHATPGGLFGVDSLGTDDAQGVIGGAHVGYNLQMNQWVIGVEGTFDGTTLSRGLTIQPVDGSMIAGNVHSDFQGSIRGRAGIVFDRLLIYGAGGVAFAGFNSDIQISGADTNGQAFVASGSRSSTRTGWTAGGGVEYAINLHWSVMGEYRYSDFGHIQDVQFPAVAGLSLADNRHLAQNQVQVGFSYKFAPPPPVVSKY